MNGSYDNTGEGLDGVPGIVPLSTNKLKKWFVMRDLKRWNAQYPAYKQLQDLGITVDMETDSSSWKTNTETSPLYARHAFCF